MQLYAEQRFIMLIWGLEAFHRKKYGSIRSDKIDRKIQKITEQIADEKDQKWLKGRLRYAAEPNLEQRIFETLKATPLGLDEKRLRRFAKSCADDRNDMSHFGEHRDKIRTYREFFLRSTKKVKPFHIYIISSFYTRSEWMKRSCADG